jgi:hypothetical protein
MQSNDQNTSIERLRIEMQQFVVERKWEQFHTPKNLADSRTVFGNLRENQGRFAGRRRDGRCFELPPQSRKRFGSRSHTGILGQNDEESSQVPCPVAILRSAGSAGDIPRWSTAGTALHLEGGSITLQFLTGPRRFAAFDEAGRSGPNF